MVAFVAAVGTRLARLRRSVRITPPFMALTLGPILLALAGCSPERYPQTALAPLSDYARIGDVIQDQTLYWAIGVFILVEGALLYAMFRFRGRPNDPEPKQVHGNTAIEIVWTLIPSLILAAIAVPTVKGIFKMNETPSGDVLEVEVVAHQWWWEFRYPEYKIVTANQLHIPVGRMISFKQHSKDVIHSFWPPRFAGKRDVFPGRETRLWFKAEEAGEFPGQCAEFCGIQHARMSFRIMAQEPADFEGWVAHMQSLGPKKPAAEGAAPAAPAPEGQAPAGQAPTTPPPAQAEPTAPVDPLYAEGEKLFMTKGCVGCHVLQAYEADTVHLGPNLANLGERTWIAAGTVPNTPENLAKWIQDPASIKEGVKMPNLGVKESEARALVAFLRANH